MKTVKVDEKNRIRIPDTEPQQVFAYEISGTGQIVLTPVAPVAPSRAKVRFVRENGRTVAETDQPISLAAIKEALAEFP